MKRCGVTEASYREYNENLSLEAPSLGQTKCDVSATSRG
jgi:hypothetical protein